MSLAETRARLRGEEPSGGLAAARAKMRAAKESVSLADLSGFTTPEETIANFTPEDRDRIAEYGPAALAGAAGLLLPGSPGIAALGGLALGTLARGATPLLKGEGVGAALHEANPLTHPWQAGLEFALPFVGKAVSAGLKARQLSKLGDYAEATSLDAPLRKFDDLVAFEELPKNVAKDTLELGAKGTVRAAFSAPARFMRRSSSKAAQIAGDRLEEYTAMQRFLETNGKRVINEAFKGLDDSERIGVTRMLRGELTTSTPRVERAAKIMREQFYDPLGSLAQKAGVLTKDAETGELIPFRMISQNYSPEIEAADRTFKSAKSLLARSHTPSQVAHQRLGNEGREILVDAKEIADTYLPNMARKIATSHSFGSPTAEVGKWGDEAERLFGQMVADGADVEATMWKNTMERVYTPRELKPVEKLAQGATGQLSKLLLGRAALRSLPQQATNVMRSGVGNTIEGLTRYATDKSFRDLVQKSGATEAGFVDHAVEMGANAKALPARLMGAVEHKLRGVGNAGAIPYIEKLVARVQGGDRSLSLLRQLDELRIPLEEAEKGVTADLLRKAFQRSSDINQYHAHALGQVGDAFRDPLPAMAAQFQPYGWAAWRNAQDSVLEPIASGVKNLDVGEVMLGGGRAARWLPGTVALSAPVTAAYGVMAGKDPSEIEPAQIGTDVAESLLGPVGGIAGRSLPPLLEGEYAEAAGEAIGAAAQVPPVVSLVQQYRRDPRQALIDMLALADRTGAVSVARSPLSALMREATR